MLKVSAKRLAGKTALRKRLRKTTRFAEHVSEDECLLVRHSVARHESRLRADVRQRRLPLLTRVCVRRRTAQQSESRGRWHRSHWSRRSCFQQQTGAIYWSVLFSGAIYWSVLFSGAIYWSELFSGGFRGGGGGSGGPHCPTPIGLRILCHFFPCKTGMVRCVHLR